MDRLKLNTTTEIILPIILIYYITYYILNESYLKIRSYSKKTFLPNLVISQNKFSDARKFYLGYL